MKKQIFYCGQEGFEGNHNFSCYEDFTSQIMMAPQEIITVVSTNTEETSKYNRMITLEDNTVKIYFDENVPFTKDTNYYLNFGISLEKDKIHVPETQDDLKICPINITISKDNGEKQEIYKGYINSNTLNINCSFNPLDDGFHIINIIIDSDTYFIQPNILTEMEEIVEEEEDTTPEDDDTTDEEIEEEAIEPTQYFNHFIIKETPFEDIAVNTNIINYPFSTTLVDGITDPSSFLSLLEINNLIDTSIYNVNIIAKQDSVFMINDDVIIIGPNGQFKFDDVVTFLGVIDGQILSADSYYSIDYDEKED